MKGAPQRGLGWIIAYKFTLAPITLGLALWLTLSPTHAYESLTRLAHELAEAGPIWSRASRWMNAQLSIHIVNEAAVFAWLGGLSTAIEGVLLLKGGVWGEWLVALGLAVLLPFELTSLVRHPTAVKAVLLSLNTIIVMYLVYRRLLPGEQLPRPS
jgi:uncharacterized membrane protein (DUF2068 family)